MADPTPADRRQPVSLPLPERGARAAPLPTQLTSFVGREREVEQVCGLLRRPETDGVDHSGR